MRTGSHKGELAWLPLRQWRVLRTLHNPRYAGAFVYDRRREGRAPDGRRTFVAVPRDQWIALISDAHPGYIGWETFEANQRLLAANAQTHGTERSAGPAREGQALLQGLVVCGRCGKRMTVRYHVRRGVEIPDYQCVRELIHSGAPRCQTVPGAAVDAAVAQVLLDTFTPLALEVALIVQAELESRADEADRMRRFPRRTRSPASRGRPAPLPRRRSRQPLGGRHAGGRLERRAPRTSNSPRRVRARQCGVRLALRGAQGADPGPRCRLPGDLVEPTTPQRERKRMARLLIDDVTLAKTDQIHLHVRFRGGQTTSMAVQSPSRRWPGRPVREPETLALLDRLLEDHTDAEVAQALNDAGRRSGEGKPFTTHIVLHLRRAHQLPSHAKRLRARGMLNLAEVAARLDADPKTINRWHAAGLLVGCKATDKHEQLFEPPTPGDSRLVKRMGSRLDRRVLLESTPEGAV